MFLRIHNLRFRYQSPGPMVLDGFSLDVGAGERVGIAGESGSGKSTLLRLVAGLERPLSGEIIMDGQVLASGRVFVEPEHRQVGLFFQDYGLFPHLTVRKNIEFGLHRLDRAARREQTERMLALIKMPELAGRYPFELSGGQQQRVALARALAPRPKVLLLDEPFSNLDAELKENIREEVKGILASTQITCLLVSHDRSDLEAVCGRIIESPAP
ncbi:ABC transporter ATP-binding protein [Oxalobacter sp. OttesenSCG-928-P03]|nr:ABC transporter ATP-binding protein [Oxalobacter sp. OttesenSCG-928-P03]